MSNNNHSNRNSGQGRNDRRDGARSLGLSANPNPLSGGLGSGVPLRADDDDWTADGYYDVRAGRDDAAAEGSNPFSGGAGNYAADEDAAAQRLAEQMAASNSDHPSPADAGSPSARAYHRDQGFGASGNGRS